eukprot:g4237.t1
MSRNQRNSEEESKLDKKWNVTQMLMDVLHIVSEEEATSEEYERANKLLRRVTQIEPDNVAAKKYAKILDLAAVAKRREEEEEEEEEEDDDEDDGDEEEEEEEEEEDDEEEEEEEEEEDEDEEDDEEEEEEYPTTSPLDLVLRWKTLAETHTSSSSSASDARDRARSASNWKYLSLLVPVLREVVEEVPLCKRLQLKLSPLLRTILSITSASPHYRDPKPLVRAIASALLRRVEGSVREEIVDTFSRILRLTMERPTKRSRVATRRDDDDSVVDADVRTASKTLLQRFLGGTTTTSDEFLRTVFRKKHFHARGGASELSRWILSEEAFGLSDLSLDRMLELTPSPQIHAWLKRSNAAAPDSTPLDSIAVEDARAAAVLHAAGASLYFRAPKDLEDALVTPLQRDLGLHFGAVFPGDGDNRGEVETFVSRTGHVTGWHFDFQDNFTIQLSGTKRWSLSPGPPCPLRGQTPHYREPVDVVEMQAKIHKLAAKRGERWSRKHPTDGKTVVVTLQAGDAFYFPAGMWHKVECVEDSISINVSIKGLTWADYVTSAMRTLLYQDAQFRRTVSFRNLAGARETCRSLLERLRVETLPRLTPGALVPAQMCRAHSRGVAGEEEAETDRREEVEVEAKEEEADTGTEKDHKEEAGAREKEEDHEEEERVSSSVEISVLDDARRFGGPSYGGTRVFRLLRPRNRVVCNPDTLYRRNPLAVLVSSAEVEGLGQDAIRSPADADLLKPLFALHVNFGTEDLQSYHKTLLVPPSREVFECVEALAHLKYGTTIGPERVAAISNVRDGKGASELLADLCYCGLLIRV